MEAVDSRLGGFLSFCCVRNLHDRLNCANSEWRLVILISHRPAGFRTEFTCPMTAARLSDEMRRPASQKSMLTSSSLYSLKRY
jgi:hypothetical protein